MPDDELTRLRALAHAATPGPWGTYQSLNGWHYTTPTTGTVTDVRSQSRADAEFIAATDPSVILALLDRVARAEEANATKDRACDEALIELEKAWRERDDARTALAAMTAERDGLPRPRYEAMQADLRRLMAERYALATLARELAHGLRVLRVTCDTAGFPLAGKAADDLLARAATRDAEVARLREAARDAINHCVTDRVGWVSVERRRMEHLEATLTEQPPPPPMPGTEEARSLASSWRPSLRRR